MMRLFNPIRQYLLLLFVLVAMQFACADSAQSAVLGSGENVLSNAQAYTDTSNQLTIDDILNKSSNVPFQQQNGLQRIDNHHTFWYKIVLPATDDVTEKWLQIDPVYLDYINFYQVNEDGSYVKQSSGIQIEEKVKPFVYRFPIFKVALQQDQQTILYLQMKSSIGQLLAARLWQPALFMNHEANIQLGWGVFFGICILLIMASLWFEGVIRDGVYGAFSLYVFSTITLTLAATGWLFQWVYHFFGVFIFPIVTLSLIWLQFASIQFLLKFLSINLIKPKVYQSSLKILLVYSLLMSAGMFTDYASMLIQGHYVIVGLIVLPGFLFIARKEIWYNNNPLRNAFLMIGSIVIVSSVVSILSLLHLLPYNDYIAGTPTVSTLFLFLLIFYTLSKRYKELSEEKDLATRRLLEITQNSEQTLKRLVDIKTKDLSEAKVKVEKSLHAERLSYQEQRNFIAMVSHEFRTPLAIIDATLQNLLRIEEDTPLQTKLQKINRSTERLTSLMSNYLSQDRLDIFLQGINASWFDMLPIIKEEEIVAKGLVPNNSFEIVIEGNTQVYADKDILKLVLHTLLENAIKYTPEGTHIRIHFHTQSNGWLIDVIDNGPGIDDEGELIFEKFYRGRTSSKKVGTGLGLTLARNLMRLQKGDLSLLNTAEQGCCFRMYIPFSETTSE